MEKYYPVISKKDNRVLVLFRKNRQHDLYISMGHQPNILTLDARAIEGLIGENHLDPALDMLKKWVDDSHSIYRKEVILLKSRYAEIKQDERRGILSSSTASRRKTKLKWDMLCLIEDITRETV